MNGYLPVVGVFAGLILYGVACDIRRRIVDRDRRRHIVECELRAKADAVRDELDAFEREAELMGLFAAQLEELQRLPEIDPWWRWVA